MRRVNRPVAGTEGSVVSFAAAAEDFLRTKDGSAASETEGKQKQRGGNETCLKRFCFSLVKICGFILSLVSPVQRGPGFG